MERMRVSRDKAKASSTLDGRFSSSKPRCSSYRSTFEMRQTDGTAGRRPINGTNERSPSGTTGRMLHSIMLHTKTDFQPLPGYGHKTADVMQRINAGVDCDEVYPNVFIGNSGAARNKEYLRRLEVSHILNCAEGHGEVETGENFYKDVGMTYLGLSLEDDSSADLESHLIATSDFIHHALLSGGRVMVNCLMGMSRSCAVVLGFLMLRRGLGAREAVVAVRRRRNVRPNGGFLRQLAHLDNRLSRERGVVPDHQDCVARRGERQNHMRRTDSGRDRESSHSTKIHKLPFKHRSHRS